MTDKTEQQQAEPEPTWDDETAGFESDDADSVLAQNNGEKPAATDDKAKGDKAADAAAADDDGDDDPRKSDKTLPAGVLKRLERLKRREREARDRAETLEAQLKERGDDVAPEGEPQAADYDSYDEFQADLQKWEAKTKPAKAKDDKDGKAPDADPNDPASPSVRARNTKALHDALADDAPEVWEKLTKPEKGAGDYEITAQMMAAMAESDDPVAVARYLADNPAETVEIAGLTPRQIERRFLKIELAAERQAKAEPEEKPARKQSRAPDPIDAGGNRRQRQDTALDAAKRDDFKAFEQIREKEEKALDGGW